MAIATPQAKGQQRHQQRAGDAQADEGRAPAGRLDEVLHDRRPDRAGQVVAARADRDRDAAAADEPQRRVGHQRREGRRTAQGPEQQPVDEREGEQAARSGRHDVAHAQAGGTDHHHRHQAGPIGQAPERDAAEAEADHQQRVRQRGVGPRDAEVGLDRRQHHRHDVHRAAAQRHQGEHDRQPRPGVARVDGVLDAAVRRIVGVHRRRPQAGGVAPDRRW
jgi:hypothetical protein